MKLIGKYSFGIGDRFSHEGKAQLEALIEAEKKYGIHFVPVWNKSNREHQIVGTEPMETRREADAAVAALGYQGQYFVDADGYISMELIGQIKCDGMTLVGLQKKIESAYKKYFLKPNVTVTFVYQAGQNMVSPWGTVTVLGEVARPGPVDVPSTMDLRLTRALFLAGGMTAIADKRRVQVTRCDKDGKQTKTKVDLVEIGEEGRPDKDMLLKAGDVVWVPMSWY